MRYHLPGGVRFRRRTVGDAGPYKENTMSYHYDWLMRQIEIIAATLAYILSKKKTHITAAYEASALPTGENELYLQLAALVRQGNICQAEDLLFEALEEPGQMALDAALRFYSDLNALSDEDLKAANFSREEILEGLQYVCQVFGIPA